MYLCKNYPKEVEKYFHINYEFDSSAAQERIAQQVAGEGAGYVCVADANILQQVHNDLGYRKVVGGLCSRSVIVVGYPYS